MSNAPPAKIPEAHWDLSASYRNMRNVRSGPVAILLGGGALWLGVAGVSVLYGQAKPEADVLLFTDGERLAGHFVKSTGSTLTFKSDALGDITVDWSKVKELQSSAKVAVIPKGVRFRRPADASDIPQGTLGVQDQQVHLAEPPRSIPVADTGSIIDQAGFQKALSHQPGFFEAWKGTVTIGAAVVNATQDSESFTGGVNLVRAMASHPAAPFSRWPPEAYRIADSTLFWKSDSPRDAKRAYSEEERTGTGNPAVTIHSGTPSTKIRLRLSAASRTSRANAYSGELYHARACSKFGNSTITIKLGFHDPSSTCTSPKRARYRPPYV